MGDVGLKIDSRRATMTAGTLPATFHACLPQDRSDEVATKPYMCNIDQKTCGGSNPNQAPGTRTMAVLSISPQKLSLEATEASFSTARVCSSCAGRH